MNPEFTYFAHISFIPEDEAFAKKLQRQLEHYRLPGKLARKFPHLPKKISPICCHSPAGDGAAADSPQRRALAASRFLVLICTPATARAGSSGSCPLDDDIAAFLSLRPENAQRVIPVIFRQKDGSSARDCLSPAIRDLNVLAADTLEKGMERALNDVVAKMLDLAPDTLWDRRQRELTRQRWFRSTAATLAAALAAASGWYAWDYYTPHVSYYTDYIERNNLPEGLFPLSEEEMAKRTFHYRFTHRKHKLVKVEYCSSSGRLLNHLAPWNNTRPAGMRFVYSSNTGELAECILMDTEGKQSDRLTFGKGHIDYKKEATTGTLSNRGVNQSYSFNFDKAFLESSFGSNGIERIAVKREEKAPHAGIIIQKRFYRHASHTPALDEQGIGGYEYKLDALGRVVLERYMAPGEGGQMHPTATAAGVAGRRCTYESRGLLTSVTSIDKEGTPIMNDNKWAQISLSYNEHGNLTSARYLNAQGAPCTNGYGFAHVTTKHDEKGQEIEDAFFDINGNPCINTLYGAARLVFTYSEAGDLSSLSTYDVTGKPCPGSMGSARQTFEYDQQGRCTRMAHFGVDGKPCLSSEGYAQLEMAYDEQGHITLKKYLGVDGKPCLTPEGVAQERSTYDHNGNQTEHVFLGLDGQPCVSKAGYARMVASYHARNDALVSISYFAADGSPCPGPEGYSHATWEYNDKGLLSQERFYDAQGKPCPDQNGFVRADWAYSPLGIRESLTGYGVDGSYKVMKCDELGQLTEHAFFNADGSPRSNELGVIRQTLQRDARQASTILTSFYPDGHYEVTTQDKQGKPTEQATFDAQGNPMPDFMGVIRKSSRYDENGHLAELTTHNADGSYNITTFSEQGAETAFFRADGSPGSDAGIARLSVEACDEPGLRKTNMFDALGNKVETVYVNMRGMPQAAKEGYARVRREFDEAGNSIRNSFFDAQGMPCLENERGCASWTTRYDEQRRPIEQSYYDLSGKLCLSKGGYARMSSRYDERGNMLEMSFCGVDEQACVTAKGYARIAWQYDERGNKIEQAHYGLNGELCQSPHGFARATWRYNERGHKVEDAYYGVDGRLCLLEEGYARLVRTVDEDGEVTELAYYGTDGQPCLIAEGYARTTTRRDALRLTREQAYFGVDGQPCLNHNGYARLLLRYDAQGHVTEQAFFGVDGQPCLVKEGYARCTMLYDERGNVVELAYFGTDSKPCAGPSGVARTVITYDAQGKMSSYRAYDAEGKNILPH